MKSQVRKNGTVSVDFAGSRQEAGEFAKEHSLMFPHGLTLGRGGGEISDGGAMLFARYIGLAERGQALRSFASLGWDEASTMDSLSK